MITHNAAKLRASLIETPEGQDNLLQISYNGETYNISEVKWVMDYEGPTGIPCPDGLLRHATEKDFEKIIENNLPIRVQKNEKKELILHYIENTK
jgi:hypothetical protein